MEVHSFLFITITFISILRVIFCGRTIERTICLLFKNKRNLKHNWRVIEIYTIFIKRKECIPFFFVISIHNVFKFICPKFLLLLFKTTKL